MKKQKFIFLDRDGVINRDKRDGYVSDWKKFRFLPGSLKALRLLKEKGYKVIVISNQAGVSKGFYSLKDLREVTRRMKRRIQAHGGKLDAVYYCPHHSEDLCSCRKPKTGLFQEAKRRFRLILFKETFMIGDSLVDIQAGKAARCKTILVLSGKEKISQKKHWEVHPDLIRKNLLEAVRWVLRQDG